MSTYDELVECRKKCRICMATHRGGIHNGDEFDFNGDEFDADPQVVGYWSQWLGHQKPCLLIVGQDFSNVDYFRMWLGFDEPENQANENLWHLLDIAGVTVKHAPEPDLESRVFLTNSVLCLKDGAMNSPIKARWVHNCAEHHLSHLIKYLSPKVVVGMGYYGWMAVRDVVKFVDSPPEQIGRAADHGEWVSLTGAPRVFAVGHCGQLGLAQRPLEKQENDWRRIGNALKGRSKTKCE